MWMTEQKRLLYTTPFAKIVPWTLGLDDDYAVAVCLVGDEMVSGVELDGLDVSAKLVHERGAPVHDTRPSPEVVEDPVDRVLVHDVEEVLPVDEVTECSSDEIEVGRGSSSRKEAI
jgi:hypothetical protein